MNSSPYARAFPAGDPMLSRAHVSPPVQSSQTARKILDTLEMMSPSPEARLLNDEPMVATEAPMSLTRDCFYLQGRRNLHRAGVSRFSSLRDTSPSNGKLEFGSPTYHPTSTVGAKESNFEDKSLVNRLFSNNEAALSNVPFPNSDCIFGPLKCNCCAYICIPDHNSNLCLFGTRKETSLFLFHALLHGWKLAHCGPCYSGVTRDTVHKPSFLCAGAAKESGLIRRGLQETSRGLDAAGRGEGFSIGGDLEVVASAGRGLRKADSPCCK